MFNYNIKWTSIFILFLAWISLGFTSLTALSILYMNLMPIVQIK
jgi:hypothetical protein